MLRLMTFAALAVIAAAAAHANDWRVDDAERVVAISDIHGAYGAMVSTLQNVGILDDELAWVGGTSRLVVVGDILDRGPRSRDVMDLLMRLEGEAQAAGGFVHVLIGNHESMNMTGDLRYVSKAEYAAFAPDETAEQRERWFQAWVRRQPSPRNTPELRKRFDGKFPPGFFALRAAFGPDGQYGAWLLDKPAIAVIDGTAFVHGGLPPVVAELGLDGLNSKLQSQLRAYVGAIYTLMEAEILLPVDDQYDYLPIVERHMPRLDESREVLAAIDTIRQLDEGSLVATGGPLWYRSNVACSGIIELHRIEDALEAIGAERVVVGHTPTPGRKVLQRFGGRLVEIDTGMLNFYYNGSGNALVLTDDDIDVHNQSGAAPYDPIPHPRSVGERPHDMPPEELATLLRTGEVLSRTSDRETGRTVVEIGDGDHIIRALFNRRQGKGFYPDIAAYRLDRLLSLDMVPVTVRREVNGRDGSVQFYPRKIMDEGERAAEGRGYSAQCPLPDQYNAMYLFDVLVFNEGRSMQRMLYDTRRWALMLVEHNRAFSTRKGRPRHLEGAPIEFTDGWRDALSALGDDVLREQLGDVLNERRIRALAERRDELLAAGG
ncbi:MAG: metallophosphoesterase [Gammaproteobacteria bacterium]|nr:metallophosphoesterase [Gammaproteobacteria bacterium]MBT8094750.1 metallophosphoesterase [Gammaproteobacteria bacterium]NNF50032.1 hypothetical protein [Woeseiaceae bacterium]NNL63168.1 hypothetical protein [Woeseiaceae bacterium]